VHEITAHYNGAGGFDDSSSTPLLQNVNKAGSEVSISVVDPTPSLTGQTYTVSGTVSAASPGSGTPTGTVTVTDSAGASCAANLAAGSWSCTLSSFGPPTGVSRTLTAVYEGDENFNGSSDTESHTVNERSISLVIVAPSQACVGETVTMTAQLSDATSPAVAGSPPFSGTVTWTLPSGPTTCTVAGSDECSVTYTPASGDVGNKTISAQYTGDPNYDDSTTINHSLNVTPRSVLIDITCQPATVYINQTANITVTVTDVGCGASVTPTGTIALSLVAQGSQAGAFVPPSGSSSGSGTIEFTGGKYTPTRNDSADDESHLIKATFTGNGDFLGITATGTFPLDVNKREVKVEVTPSVSAAFVDEVVTVHVALQDTTSGTSPCCVVFSMPAGQEVEITLDDLSSAGGFDTSLTGSFAEGPYTFVCPGHDSPNGTYTFGLGQYNAHRRDPSNDDECNVRHQSCVRRPADRGHHHRDRRRSCSIIVIARRCSPSEHDGRRCVL
jgi:hypothetical protein